MAEIKWTTQALEDIENIADYIAKDSPYFASVQVERFLSATEQLLNQPTSGRIVPEIKNPQIRELITGNYRIIYRILSENRVDILTIHHSSKLIRDSRLR